MTDSLLRRIAAALVARPWFYDLVQNAAGRSVAVKQLKAVLPQSPATRVLDVGSAGGSLSARLGFHPVSLDIDVLSVVAARRRSSDALALVGDAANLPFPTYCFDLSLCLDISHHLPDTAWSRMLAELSRVTGGTLIFLDAVRDDARNLSRFLWRYDRGRFPRTRDDILQALGREFLIRKIVEFSVYHRYVLCIASPGPAKIPAAGAGILQQRTDGLP